MDNLSAKTCRVNESSRGRGHTRHARPATLWSPRGQVPTAPEECHILPSRLLTQSFMQSKMHLIIDLTIRFVLVIVLHVGVSVLASVEQ